jgi:hypothetical protein
MLSGVPMSTMTVAAEKLNTAVELNVQGVLRIILNFSYWTLLLLLLLLLLLHFYR